MLDRVGRDAIGRATGAERRGSIGRRPMVESLEGRALMTAAIAPIAATSVPQYQGYQLPVEGETTHQQTYTVTSDNPGVKASIAQGQFLTFTVAHSAGSTAGDINVNGSMTFQLFSDVTPNTVQQIESLITGTATNANTQNVKAGTNFYVGKPISRIAAGFPTPADYIVQGGGATPTTTNNGNAFLTPFADEFNQSVAFTGAGQLAMANSGADTNDSQFFITTTGAPQFLSYHHTIFGQIVSGQDILAQLTQISLNGTAPVNPVTITAATLSNANPNGVIHIDTTLAPANATANLTVTATDVTDGTTASQTFPVDVTAPYSTQPLRPFVGPYDQQITVAQGQAAKLQIFAVSPTPGDPLTFTVQGGVTAATGSTPPAFTAVNSAQLTATVNAATGLVTVTPVATFSGSSQILIGVRDNTNRTNGEAIDAPDNYEFHLIKVVVPASATPVAQRPLTTQQAITANTRATTPIQLTGTSQSTTATLPVTYAITTQPTHGTITLDAATGLAQYTPTPGYVGPDAVAYTVTDPNSNTTSFPTAINITVQDANTGAVRFIANNGTNSTTTPGILVITPVPRTDGGTNVIRAAAVNGVVQVTVNGVLDQLQPTTANVDRIVIYGSKASDRLTIDPSLSTIATIDGGHGGENVLTAGAGQTREHGWFGSNRLVQGSSDNYQLGRRHIGDVFVKGTGSSNVIFLGEPGHFRRHLSKNRQLPTPTTGTYYKFAANGKTLVTATNPYLALRAKPAMDANADGTTGRTSTTVVEAALKAKAAHEAEARKS